MTKKRSLIGIGLLAWVAACGTQCGLEQNDGGAGNLRVLITDKPYPFEWIEEALVTITKVEIRRAGSSLCEEQCDDGLYCNGFENCVDGECRSGFAPCADGQFCDETIDICRDLCESGADCDDGLYCNGAESCNLETGECRPGTPPCETDLFCHEDAMSCTDLCSVDAHCEDGLFCNGTETCDTGTGECQDGQAPVCGDDEICDEDADACGDSEPAAVSPFIVIFEGERTFDLLDLQNGRSDLLAEAEDLPAGHYNLMRVYVTRGKITLKDDAGVFNLTVPSGAQTGIKLHFDFEIPAGGEATLILDVDLSRAFSAIPSGHIDDPSTIENFHFSPSVAMRLINVLEAGNIAGLVTAEADGSPIAGASVTAYDEDDNEVTSTSTDDDGTYVLSGLVTGAYRVEFSASGFEDGQVLDVEVTAGETTEGVDAALSASGG